MRYGPAKLYSRSDVAAGFFPSRSGFVAINHKPPCSALPSLGVFSFPDIRGLGNPVAAQQIDGQSWHARRRYDHPVGIRRPGGVTGVTGNDSETKSVPRGTLNAPRWDGALTSCNVLAGVGTLRILPSYL